MKTHVIGLLFIGFTNLLIAQNDLAVLESPNSIKLSKPSKIIKNSDYLKTMTALDISKKILNLQDLVANYDIKKHQVYNPKSKTTYTVKFKESKNVLSAVYDKNGKLLSSKEQYQDIKLPYSLSSEIIKTNPGWSFKEVYCSIKYIQNAYTNLTYRVILNNGRKTKTILIDL